MIRTRDLVVFVSIVLFLGICILVTLAAGRENSVLDINAILLGTSETGSTTYTAHADKRTIDRKSNIERLRDALSRTVAVIVPEPPEEEVPDDTTPYASSTPSAASGSIQLCTEGDDSLALRGMWPASDVFLITEGSNRAVVHIEKPVTSTSTASSTSAAVDIKTLLRVPLNPLAQGTSVCVPSDIVGVTESGSLILNTAAGLYKSRGENERIGYARDGFPIYGVYTGTVDACGGYMHNSQYRYTVSQDRDYILGCFSASPSSFEI